METFKHVSVIQKEMDLKYKEMEANTLTDIKSQIEENITKGEVSFKISNQSQKYIMTQAIIDELTRAGYQIIKTTYKSVSERDDEEHGVYNIIWAGENYKKPGTFTKKFQVTENKVLVVLIILSAMFWILK